MLINHVFYVNFENTTKPRRNICHDQSYSFLGDRIKCSVIFFQSKRIITIYQQDYILQAIWSKESA